MEEIKRYKTSDLVLKVDKNFNPQTLPLHHWERYIDILVNGRQYQKEAIKNAIIFLASGLYPNLSELVEENWKDSKNIELKNNLQEIKKIKSKKFEIKAKADNKGTLYAKITSKIIAEELSRQGYKIASQAVKLNETIKKVGEYKIQLSLEGESAEVIIEVNNKSVA